MLEVFGCHPGKSIHLGACGASSVGKAALATEAQGIRALMQRGEKMQVLAGAVCESTEVDPGRFVQAESALFLCLSQCGCTLGLARFEQAFRNVPVAPGGLVA